MNIRIIAAAAFGAAALTACSDRETGPVAAPAADAGAESAASSPVSTPAEPPQTLPPAAIAGLAGPGRGRPGREYSVRGHTGSRMREN